MSQESERDVYQPPQMDRLGWLLVAVVWAATVVDVAIVWTPLRSTPWLVLDFCAFGVVTFGSLWALLRSREPLLRRPHWSTFWTFLICNSVAWFGLMEGPNSILTDL